MLYEFVQCLGLIESCHRQDTASTPLGTVAARACCALATSNRPQRQQSLWQKPRPTVDLIIQPVATWGLKNRPQGSIGKRSQNWLAKEKPAALCRNEEQPSEKKVVCEAGLGQIFGLQPLAGREAIWRRWPPVDSNAADPPGVAQPFQPFQFSYQMTTWSFGNPWNRKIVILW